MDDPEEAEHELVMPFVVCSSKGGPYDDSAFVAGYRCGQFDQILGGALGVGGPAECTFPAEPGLVPQLDLLAMHHGYTLVAVPWKDGADWVTATFTKNQDG